MAASVAFVGMGAGEALAASCSSFAIIKSYDADSGFAEVEFKKGNKRKYFPQVEGSTGDTQKIPKKCKRKVTKNKEFLVKNTGGRMSITQFRSNFQGKMINDTDDKEWVGKHINELIANKELVVIVIRPGMGKDAPLGLTTIYLPITPEEEKEIERLNNQAEDV
jgi:hypothetical protein